MIPIDFVALRGALVSEIRTAWKTLHVAHPGEDFYAFGVYSNSDAGYLTITASTEQGLDKVVEKYRKITWTDSYKTGNLHDRLRWSQCDSPLHEEGEDLLTRSAEIKGYWEFLVSDEQDEAIYKEVDLVFETVISALQELSENKG